VLVVMEIREIREQLDMVVLREIQAILVLMVLQVMLDMEIQVMLDMAILGKLEEAAAVVPVEEVVVGLVDCQEQLLVVVEVEEILGIYRQQMELREPLHTHL
jgi:hypothetical protein